MADPRLIAGVVGAAVAALRASIRIERRHFDRYLGLRARGVSFVFTLWHGRMFLPILSHLHEGIVTMASRSKDGEIIARWLQKNGYVVSRGSSGKGGVQGLSEMIDELRSGRAAALTVDGPKGPPRVSQPGIVHVARETGAWILPITASSARGRFLASWDRYLVPYPFSRNVVVYGEPFPIPAEMPAEEALSRITKALDEVTREADAAMGIVPPPPWA